MKKAVIPTIFLAVAVALCVSVVFCPTTTSSAAASDKVPFVFDETDAVVLFDGKSAAVYFRNYPDVNYEYEFTFKNAAGETFPYPTKNQYAVPVEGEYETVTVTVKRKADETYDNFEKVLSETSVNSTVSPAQIPAGQKITYDGNEHSYKNVTFYKGSDKVSPVNAGQYIAEIACDAPFKIVFTIEKAAVTATCRNMSYRYGETPVGSAETLIIGRVSDADVTNIKNNVTVTLPYGENPLVPGSYDIIVNYGGEPSDNYVVNAKNATLTVLKGVLTGFTFEDESVLYDGKAHSIAVRYDEETWSGVGISYSVDSVSDAGKYEITATVKKELYEDLLLTATLLIKTTSIESNDLADFVSISDSKNGFDPTLNLSLTKTENAVIIDEAAKVLKSDEKQKEAVKAIYKITALSGGSETELADEVCTINIKADGISSSDGVRVFVYRNGVLTEKEYTFDNGTFTINGSPVDLYVFAGKSAVAVDNRAVVLNAVLVGIAVIIVLLIIIEAFSKSGKDKKRRRKKHSRWA